MKKLDDEQLNWLTNRTNRSNGQTQFLYDLVDGDFEKLKQLEMQLANCLVNYCPADMETVDMVMTMKPKCSLLIWK